MAHIFRVPRHVPMSGCPAGQWLSGQNCSPRHLTVAKSALANSGHRQIRIGRFSRRPSPRGVQCFTGPASGVFFGARVTRQPQTTNANWTATKIPSSRLSTMLFSASGRSASVRGAGTPSPFGSTTQPSMLRFQTVARHVAGQGAGAVCRRGREDAAHHGRDWTGL